MSPSPSRPPRSSPGPDPDRKSRSLRTVSIRRIAAFVLTGAMIISGVWGAVSPASAQSFGLDAFAKPPETPLELWEAIDYLTRIDHYEEAAPLLTRFLESDPDDITLLTIRDRFGVGSILRLEDDERTAGTAERLLERLGEATKRYTRDPERIRDALARLTSDIEVERDLAVRDLRDAQSDAIPYWVEALRAAGPDSEDWRRLVAGAGRLDRRAVPGLIAVLDAPDRALAAAAAEALGGIGDARALPFLVAAASGDEPITEAARAYRAITGRSLDALPQTPAEFLAQEALRYLTGRYEFPGEQVELWVWNGDGPAPRSLSANKAELWLGLALATRALERAPDARRAGAVLHALTIRQRQNEPDLAVPALPEGFETDWTATLRLTLDHQLWDVAAQLLETLDSEVKQAGPDSGLAQALPARGSPALDALRVPDRLVRFRAAQALVDARPERPFLGSSRVVPILSSMLRLDEGPTAIVIDRGLQRANAFGERLRALGYHVESETDPWRGFELAAASSAVELIAVAPASLGDTVRLIELLTQLRADPRTAGLPVFLYGDTLRLGQRLRAITEPDPWTTYIIFPENEEILARRIEEFESRGARLIDRDQRARLPGQAATALAAIARRVPGGAFRASDLADASRDLQVALYRSDLAAPAAEALAVIPSVAAQQTLAEAALDTTREDAARAVIARRLVASLRRFGVLIDRSLARRLDQALRSAESDALAAALSEAIEALDRRPPPIDVTGRRSAAEE